MKVMLKKLTTIFDVRDVHAYFGLALMALGAGLYSLPLGPLVLGSGLFYLAVGLKGKS
jgi:hypothetical protein